MSVDYGGCSYPIRTPSPSTPQSRIEVLQRALAERQVEVTQWKTNYSDLLANSQAMIARWKKAVEGLTPSGSEFVDDPETCARYIRNKISLVLLGFAKRVNEAEAEIERLNKSRVTILASLTAAAKHLDDKDAEIARLTAAIKSWKAEELLWKEREAEQLAYLENQGKQLHEERIENCRLTARLSEADHKLEALRKAGEVALQIGRDAEEARVRYVEGEPV